MQTIQLTSIDLEILAGVVGGREDTGGNVQDNQIGVQAGDVNIGLSERARRTDYGLCLQDSMARNFTPKQIRKTCGLPPATTGGAP